MNQTSHKMRPHMQALTDNLPTKSAKIRALSAAGYKRQEIADFLGIRYQHVRNVLLQPLALRGVASAPARPPGFAEHPVPAIAGNTGEADEASGNIVVEPDGRVALPESLRRAFGWQPGRRVFWVRESGTIRLFSEEAALRFAQALVAKHVKSSGDIVDEFLKERREEARRDDRG